MKIKNQSGKPLHMEISATLYPKSLTTEYTMVKYLNIICVHAFMYLNKIHKYTTA